MLKKTILLGILFASLHITTSQEQPIIEVIELEDIPYTESYEPSEVNYDSFAVSVISFCELLDDDKFHYQER